MNLNRPLPSGMESGDPRKIDGGGSDLAHWDLASHKAIDGIARQYHRSPKAFRSMTPEKQDRLVRILEGSMAEAERMQQSEDEAVRLKGAMLGESLSRAGGLLVSLQLRDEHHADDHNQRERHHADDLEVAKANAVSQAAQAGLVPKVYIGLDPGKV